MKAALLARVSTEEQVEGYSLDAQRRAFNTLVQGRGWTVYRRNTSEEGRSAHTDDINKRPIFKEAIEDALAKRYDVLVVSQDRPLLPGSLELPWNISKSWVKQASVSYPSRIRSTIQLRWAG